MAVPPIGPIISSAMVAAIGTGDVFSKGRDFAAWLGLVPRQVSTGGREERSQDHAYLAAIAAREGVRGEWFP
jgi:transposase